MCWFQPGDDTITHAPGAIATDFATMKRSSSETGAEAAQPPADGDRPPAAVGHGTESGAGTVGFLVDADIGPDGTLPVGVGLSCVNERDDWMDTHAVAKGVALAR